jgi:hypothetical protein
MQTEPPTDPTIRRHAAAAGQPLPDTRPQMTEKELSFHKAQAGLKAAEAAEANPVDEIAMSAIMTAGAGPVEIGRLSLQPITLGTLKALREAKSVFVADESRAAEEDDICLAILIFADPRRCWRAFRQRGEEAEALRSEAEELAFELSLDQLRAAGAWINGQLLALNQVAGDGEDHTAPPEGNSPGKPAES